MEPTSGQILLPADLIEAMWHCYHSAANNDNSLGPSNSEQYERLYTFLTEEADVADA